MAKDTLISIIVIVSLILIGLGVWLGINLQKEQSFSEVFQPGFVNSVSTLVSGEVKEVSRDEIVLIDNQSRQTISLRIPDDVKVFQIRVEEGEEGGSLLQEEVSLSDVRAGDVVDIFASFLQGGIFEVREINVLP